MHINFSWRHHVTPFIFRHRRHRRHPSFLTASTLPTRCRPAADGLTTIPTLSCNSSAIAACIIASLNPPTRGRNQIVPRELLAVRAGINSLLSTAAFRPPPGIAGRPPQLDAEATLTMSEVIREVAFSSEHLDLIDQRTQHRSLLLEGVGKVLLLPHDMREVLELLLAWVPQDLVFLRPRFPLLH